MYSGIKRSITILFGVLLLFSLTWTSTSRAAVTITYVNLGGGGNPIL